MSGDVIWARGCFDSFGVCFPSSLKHVNPFVCVKHQQHPISLLRCSAQSFEKLLHYSGFFEVPLSFFLPPSLSRSLSHHSMAIPSFFSLFQASRGLQLIKSYVSPCTQSTLFLISAGESQALETLMPAEPGTLEESY